MLNSYAFASSRNMTRFIYKQKKKSMHTVYSQKKWYFYKKNHKNTAFRPKICNSQQVCLRIKKYKNDKYKSNQKLK